jgi:FAD/FMN-containing dehydrogenase
VHAKVLGEDFDGVVIEPGSDGYDEARAVFNAMIDRRPALIAQCASAADIKAAFEYAAAQGLAVALRAGGHSVAGASTIDGGLVIDMRRMNSVEIDPEARTARVQGGATWHDFDTATQPHGLATTGGRVSTTGVAGLTLGGGSGWLERKFGLACDSLVAVDLVTPDGREVRASEDENEELFWALHGAGGNFGVATELTFKLHELPVFTAAISLWPAERGPELALAYRDLVDSGAPEGLGGGVAYLTGPPEEFLPESLHGQRCAGIISTFAGTEAEAREVLAPLLALEPEGGLFTEMPYVEFQRAIDDPPGFRNYWSAEHLSELPDEAIEVFCAQGEEMIVPSPSQHLLIPWGGQVERAGEAWPLPHRSASWVVHPFGLWDSEADDERGKAWARRSIAELKPWATGAVYLNFIGDEGEDRVIAGFGRENYDRLAAVKAEYDPGNVLNLHHNIRPLATA